MAVFCFSLLTQIAAQTSLAQTAVCIAGSKIESGQYRILLPVVLCTTFDGAYIAPRYVPGGS